jgi:maltodextrin utilization protein YvdJ
MDFHIRKKKENKIKLNNIIINPDSLFRQIWNISILVIYLSSLILIPLKLSFCKDTDLIDLTLIIGILNCIFKNIRVNLDF